jgi:glutamyl-tRNA synthetase
MSVRVRFAPSPTGYLHIGGARTALFNWLFARHEKGSFILRIEDTDRERSTEAAVHAILDSLRWLGLDWDEGPIFQTQRLENYRQAAELLKARGRAYECTCTPEELEEMRTRAQREKRKPKYDGRCRERPSHPGRPAVVRFRSLDSGVTVVPDLIKGKVEFDNRELDDLVILRADGMPTYNFGVVVDDHDLRITHVLRGDDHLNNTPRQMQIYEALGWSTPQFAHVPMILGADKQRLSKRHGATSVTEYRDQGILPWALANYLARLGWSAGDQEIFSQEELIAAFSLEGIGSAPSVFSPDKLLWVNAHYLRQMSPEALAEELAPFLGALAGRDVASDPRLPKIAALRQPRDKSLLEMAKNSFYFFADDESISYDPKARAKFLTASTRPILEKLAARLEALPDFDVASLERVFTDLCAELGEKMVNLAQPARVALTGGTASPGIHEVMELIGKASTVARLRRAAASIEA